MFTLEKQGSVFILTLTGDGEHRLGPPVISSLLQLLEEAKSQSTRGSVLVTTSSLTSKFFSNGFDLRWARSAPTPDGAVERLRSMVDAFRPVVAAFLALPMPTVAAVPGHAAAAGFLLALCHDYVIVRRDRGFLYMSEVDIGLTLPDYFAAVFRAKIGSPRARRDALLRGAKIGGDDALRMGIADAAHDGGEGTVEAAMRLAEQLGKKNWDGLVYAEIRKTLYPELCGMFGLEAISRKPKL